MAISINTEVAGGYSVVPFVDTINASKHINRILQGADAIRRVRPDATYATERWCTPAGAGTKAGTSLANAYGLAELNTALATLSGTHVYMVGTFEPATATTDGPLIGPVVGDNVRLDFATYRATVRGFSNLSWSASGVNGEYYATVSSSQGKFRLTENGQRMDVTNGLDASWARQTITAIDIAANTVTVEVFKEFAVDDPVAFISSAANGLTPGTLYYVKTASAVSSGAQTLSLSTTIGGAAVDITGTLSGSRFLWSLYNGRYGDPVPGSLLPGQAAYAPHESRMYIKPSSGVPSDHLYTLWQTGTQPYLLVVSDAAGAADNTEIIGGDWYGAGGAAVFIGDGTVNATATNTKVYGTRVHATMGGVITSGAVNADLAWNEVYDLSDHALGSKNGVTSEPGQRIRYNWVYDLARLPGDYADDQAIVTNPASDYTEILGNVIQRIGHNRDYLTYPLGPNYSVNTGAIVVDSSSFVRIVGNYCEECYGEAISLSPNDVQSSTYCQIQGNVFDQRNLDPALEDISDANLTAATIRLQITSASASGYGMGYDSIIDGNLFIVGNVRDMQASSFTIAALVDIRNARSDAATAGQITVRNNVVVCTNATAAWNIMAIRAKGSADSVTGIDSDWNTYYSANSGVFVAHIQNDTSIGNNPDTTVSLSTVESGTGWTSPDGTVSDKHSTVWTASDLEDTMPTNPTVLRCLGL